MKNEKRAWRDLLLVGASLIFGAFVLAPLIFGRDDQPPSFWTGLIEVVVLIAAFFLLAVLRWRGR